MCAKCGTSLEGHEMFGECFPHEEYRLESSVLLHQGHLIAV